MADLGRSYRTYALDFWGFGESDKKRLTYDVQDFVSLVCQFMDQLGIESAPLVGHSMGGTVSLLVAIQFPERVRQVLVIGSPITGSSLSLLLKLFGKGAVAKVVYRNLWGLKLGFRLLAPLYSRDRRWYAMMQRDLSRTTLESFRLSIASLHKTDLRPYLGTLRIPVLGMYGEMDNVVCPEQWKLIQEGIPRSQVVRFPHAGHFIMLDEPQEFIAVMRAFLDGPLSSSDAQTKDHVEDHLTEPALPAALQ
jgi:pimeloyl-ACP methyl ester carboxylesterase